VTRRCAKRRFREGSWSSATADSLGSCPQACDLPSTQALAGLDELWHCWPRLFDIGDSPASPDVPGEAAYEPATFFATLYFSQRRRAANTATRAQACSVSSAGAGIARGNRSNHRGNRNNRGMANKYPSALTVPTRDRVALYAVNFFMADMEAGMGPFLGVPLQGRGWSTGAIGAVITLGAIVGMLTVTPAGALVDAATYKRGHEARTKMLYMLTAAPCR
jgi:hypothetical protein